MHLHLKYYTHVSIVYMSLHKWSQTCVNACTFVGKRGFRFAQTRLDVNLDRDGTVFHNMNVVRVHVCVCVCVRV